jgi:EAL domain-containing protein (putative c-di-GMP-specific phosphodiesterase class I)
VRDLAVDRNDKAVVRTTIAMANSLNLGPIAEGLETRQQREILRDNGCMQFQGYLFGRPLPIEALELLLRQLAV